MPTYERRTQVAAPLSEVWAFHDRIEGLVALTPGWMNLEVEDVVGPGGEPTEALRAGTRIHLSLRPLGLGPRQYWTSRITERSETETWARFCDVMERGPFPRWRHTHRFDAVDGGTRVTDRVEYALPLGRVGAALEPLAMVGFEPMFGYRHRRTRALLE